MSNKKDKELEALTGNLTKLKKDLEKLTDGIHEPITKMMEFNDLSEEITKLKDGIVPPKQEDPDELTKDDFDTTPPVDGETCMHGNSWHSNCSECDDLDDTEVALNEMSNIIDNEPNDKKLGTKIRDFYHKWIEFNENKVDTTVD